MSGKTNPLFRTQGKNHDREQLDSRAEWIGPIFPRGLLELAAAAGLGLAAPSLARAAADSALQAKARKNLKLGIMSNVYAELPVAEAARQIKADGFACVVTDFAFADVHFNALEPDWAAAKKIVSTLEGQGSRSPASSVTTTSSILM